MSKENRELILSVMRANGRADALDLRSRAPSMDDTAIIAEEHKIPAWKQEKDYSAWAVGSPVVYDGQVYGLIQPHNAANYPDGTPENAPALWGIKHTTDPAKAKAFFAPNGTSGLYAAGECCVWDGAVYRCTRADNPYSPGEYADWWELVT